MAHAFPQETIELVKRDLERVKKPFDFFSNYISLISNSNLNFYGFEEHLRTGEYAPYFHEMKEKDIWNYNCTTIIPTVYLNAELLGLKPRIVKFMGMADYAVEADEKPKVEEDAGHYCLLVEHEKVNYLCDPFWNVFAPIASVDLQHGGPGQIILYGHGHEYVNTRKRTFKKWKFCSAEEFAAMMKRLKDPAESLDMLVSGQNYGRFNVASSPCSFNVYYDDETNTITTRLYIPQPEISDKALICHQKLDDEGEIEAVNYEFYLAESRTWDKLVGEKRIAVTGSKQLKVGVNKENELLIIFDLLIDNFLSEERRTSIRPQTLARSLYSAALTKKKDYLYSLDEHDEFLISGLREINEQGKQKMDCELKLSLHSSGLEKMVESTAEEIRSERDRIKITQEKKEILVRQLGLLRMNDLDLYRLNRDLVLFAQRELAGLSLEQLEAKAAEVSRVEINPITGESTNWASGYSEMLCDFLCYLHSEVMDKLLLKEYMPSISEKVRARRAKRQIQ